MDFWARLSAKKLRKFGDFFKTPLLSASGTAETCSGAPGGPQTAPKSLENHVPETFFSGLPFRPRFGTDLGTFLGFSTMENR